jgi:hypothetical protein
LRRSAPLKRNKGLSRRRTTDRRNPKPSDVSLYESVWKSRAHICEVSGKKLGKEPLTIYFHHILSKSKYPQYRWCAWNILLVSPEIHSQIETNISKLPYVEQLTMNLKQKHLNGDLPECKDAS